MAVRYKTGYGNALGRLEDQDDEAREERQAGTKGGEDCKRSERFHLTALKHDPSCRGTHTHIQIELIITVVCNCNDARLGRPGRRGPTSDRLI